MAVTWTGAAWVTATPYVVSARVVNVGNVYRCTVAGTSGAGPGPTGTSNAITDGSCTWQYLGADGGAVTGIAPELSTIVAAEQNAVLDIVDRQVADPDAWGDYIDDGRRYLAAHLAALSKLRGRGPVTAEAVGAVSRSYGDMLTFGALGLTAYGVEYQRLVRLLPTALGEVF